MKKRITIIVLLVTLAMSGLSVSASFDGINGDVTDDGHDKWTDIISIDWSSSTPTPVPSPTPQPTKQPA